MKVKVENIFRDKYTNKIHKKDEVLTVDKNRYKEIKEYVKIIDEKSKD